MSLLKQNIKQKSGPFFKGALFLCLGFFILGCGDWALNGSRERTPIETPLLEKQARLTEKLEKTSLGELSSADSSADSSYPTPSTAQDSDLEAKSEGMGEQGESVQGQSGDQSEPDCDCNTKKESNPDVASNTNPASPSNDQSIDSSSLDQATSNSSLATSANTSKSSASLTNFTDCSSINTDNCANVKDSAKVCALVRETKNQKTSEVWLEFENYCSACSTSSMKIQDTKLEVVGFKLGSCPEEEELASE